MTSLYHTEQKLQAKIGQKVSQPIVRDVDAPRVGSPCQAQPILKQAY